MKARGFTLLEVLVAISILGIGLTVILSSQVALFSSSQRVANLSIATGLARCHMNEVELKLVKEGYPFVDTKDEGLCCNDEITEGFTCASRVERIELPQLSEVPEDENANDPLGLNSGDGPLAGGDLGPLGGLADLQKNGLGALGGDSPLGGVASLLGGGSGGASGGGAMSGLISMVMGLVYPNLKLMLEASIRKVTIVVNWKEGSFVRDLTVVQYVTNPQQGGFDPFAEEKLDAAQGAPGAPGAPASPGSPSSPFGGLFK